MAQTAKRSFNIGIFLGLIALGLGSLYWSLEKEHIVPPVVTKTSLDKHELAEQVAPFFKANNYPEELNIKIDEREMPVRVQYTLSSQLQFESEKMLKKFKPDYGALIALDAKTGKILAMASYERDGSNYGNLNLLGSFPAASIFKVVTAAAAIDSGKASSNTVIAFNGAYHTLYKRNISSTQHNRWTRYMTLREAFAKSVNTVFGKLGVFHVGGQELEEYAEKFKFNQDIITDLPLPQAKANIQDGDHWTVVQAASGFTKENTMSPVHGALIAAAVANNGVMMEPYIIDHVVDESGHLIYKAEPKVASVTMEPRSAREMRVLMRETIYSGTSRRWFRPFVRGKKFRTVEVGGKTGSLTGKEPRGKYDWFVGYADTGEDVIAVAALTINEKVWRVKSSHLAGEFFSKYIDSLADDDVSVSAKGKSNRIISQRESSGKKKSN